MTDGFLYAATGERWVREAVSSATRLREFHPDTPTILYTNLPGIATSGPFDEVHEVPDRNWVRTEVKLWAVNRSPFDRTVFLDTDTYACADLTELFTVLDRFDFAAVPAPLRLSKHGDHADPEDIPDAFQTVNGGLFSWRWNDRTRSLFEMWWDLYQADKTTSSAKVMDQPSLRVALWRSDCHILHLPPEFNVRTIRYKFQPMTAVGSVRVIHGRPKDIEALERRWNARTEPRLLTPILQYQARLLARFLTRGRAAASIKRNSRDLLKRRQT